MSDLIKKGFARKAIQEKTTSSFRKFFSFARSNAIKDFVFYVIMICGGWALASVAIMAGWNWGPVSTFPILRPMDFVSAMGWAIIAGLIFLFLYLLGEVK